MILCSFNISSDYNAHFLFRFAMNCNHDLVCMMESLCLVEEGSPASDIKIQKQVRKTKNLFVEDLSWLLPVPVIKSRTVSSNLYAKQMYKLRY
jgi:hypothetical protein